MPTVASGYVRERCMGDRRVLRALRCAAFYVLAVLLLHQTALSADRFAATTSRTAKQEAIKAMRLDQLEQHNFHAAQSVLRRVSIYRRLPTRVIDCDPEIFTMLIRNPHMIANTWEVLGLSKLRMIKNGEGSYSANDGNGTKGIMRVLSSSYGENAKNFLLLYGEGTYEGKPFLHPAKARCLLLLRSGAIEETNGRHYVTARLDSFVQVEQAGLDIVARTLHPLLGRTADSNFIETMKFVSNFSRTAERNPTGMERLARRLKKVEPRTRKLLVAKAYELSEDSRVDSKASSVAERVKPRRQRQPR